MNPKELMISRYEAFEREDWEYLAKTSVSQTLAELQETPSIEWLKLEVIDAYDDVVEFKAYYRYRENDSIYILHEKSRFVFKNSEWKYLDGEIFNYDARVFT